MTLYDLRVVVLVVVTLHLCADLRAQCGPGTPSFTVNLSANPDTTWTSVDTVRKDTCCGATAPDKCVKFIVTLHPAAVGIKFDVCDGALPPGALFYQVGCGTPQSVGTVLCLSGVGPHTITFCKPGNNVNKYCITSIPKAQAGPPIAVNDGCIGELYSSGFEDTSITWRSVAPGFPGAYNSYLNCLKGCETVQVRAQAGFPAFVDFEVCGRTIGGCDPPPLCDTVRAFFNSTLRVDILPENPTVCFGSPHTTITANGSGGTPPYNYTWSTGATTQSINTNVGTYIVEMGDSSGCPPTFDTVTVTSFANTIQAQAGDDTTVCNQHSPFQLSGNVIAAGGGQWFGGGGSFSPSPDSLNAKYTPSAGELSSGFVDLYLRTTFNGTCPADTDTVRLNLVGFTASYSLLTKNVSCFGGLNGWARVSGLNIGNIVWDSLVTNTNLDSALSLGIGTYGVTILDTNGCSVDTTLVINQPLRLQVDSISTDSALCFDSSNASAFIQVFGGSTPYSYIWPLRTSQSNGSFSGLKAGSYRVTITDSNSCSIDTLLTLNEPDPLNLFVKSHNLLCNNDSSGWAFAWANGGSPGYNFNWMISARNITGDTAIGLPADSLSLNVTDSKGCKVDTLLLLTEPDLLYVDSIIANDVLCFGDSSGFAFALAKGGTTPHSFQWTGNGYTLNSDSALWLTTGTYVVEIRDSNNCLARDTAFIREPAPLSVAVSANNATCFMEANGSVRISPAGGLTPYSFQWDPKILNSISDSAYLLDTGVYAVRISDSNQCYLDTTFQILQPTELTNSLRTYNVSCFGFSDGSIKSVPAGGTPPFFWQWPIGAAGQGADSTYSLSAGTYILKINDSLGCVRRDTIVITEPGSLGLQLTKNTADTLCAGDQILFRAQVTGGTPVYQYNWSNGASADSASVVADTSFTMSVEITDNNSCPPLKDSLRIEVRNLFDDTLSIINEGPVCLGDTHKLHSFHMGAPGPFTYSYNVQGPSGTGSFELKVNQSRYVVFSVSDVCNNSIEDSTLLEILPLPQIALSDSLFQGCMPLSIRLSNSNHQSDYTYTWNLGDGTTLTSESVSYVYPEAGNFNIQVEAKNGFGCRNELTDKSRAIVWPKPEADFTANKYTAKLKDALFDLTNTTNGTQNIQWYVMDSLAGIDQQISLQFMDTGRYTIILFAITDLGCRDTAFEVLEVTPDHVIRIPNAFIPSKSTPGDGRYDPEAPDNRVFFPFTDYVEEFNMTIFNRWGELIFESDDILLGWNGYYKGELSQQDVYLWKIQITFSDGVKKELVGDVSLIH